MQEQYAIVRAGVVADVVFAGEAFVTAMVARACFGAPRIQEVGDEIYGPVDDEVAVGWTRDPETGVFAPPVVEVPEVDLGGLKSAAVASLNAAAERAFNHLMSPGRVQVLLEQARQADAIPEMNPLPDPADYPLLAACIGPWGADIGEVMLAAIDKAARWRISAAAIEAVRASAQAAICSAEDADEIRAIMAALAWP